MKFLPTPAAGMSTHEPLDIDRFRRGLGDVEDAYREVLHRLTGYVYKYSEEDV